MVALSVPVYGGATHDYYPDSTCPRCGASIDRHRIHSIFPSERTIHLVRTLQDLLDQVDRTSRQKGYQLPQVKDQPLKTTMVGAAHAIFSNHPGQPRDYVTFSGPGYLFFTLINRGRLGKKVVIVDTYSAMQGNTKLYGIDGVMFVPAWDAEGYPIGSCAAQKLMTAIFMDVPTEGTVMEIQMSEIMWRSSQRERVPQTSRQWSSGHEVSSCITCKQVLPQMLCDKHD